MSIFELHPKHCIRQSFCHGTLYFDNIFFGHVFLRSFLRLKFRLRLDGSRFEPGHLVVWQSYVRSEQKGFHQP